MRFLEAPDPGCCPPPPPPHTDGAQQPLQGMIDGADGHEEEEEEEEGENHGGDRCAAAAGLQGICPTQTLKKTAPQTQYFTKTTRQLVTRRMLFRLTRL